jgi:sigma-B regulation protein RsbU (phosphoserine phosphatase)
MNAWLRGRTVFQRVAFGLLALAVAAALVSSISGRTTSAEPVILASLLVAIALRKELLWRVRNRLLLTYFLFGVVPIVLIGWSMAIAAQVLLGQFAAQHVRQELEQRIQSVRSLAQQLALAASHGVGPDALDGTRRRVPRVAAIVRTSGDALRLPADTEIPAEPGWIPHEFAGLFESGGRYYLGAEGRDGGADAFAYLPLDGDTLASLAPGVVSVSTIAREGDSVEIGFRLFSNRLAVVQHGVRKQIEPSGLEARGWWDVPIAGTLPWRVETSSESSAIELPVMSRPSVLVGGIMSGRAVSIAVSLLFFVGGSFLIVEAVSLISSVRLTRAITRSVDDLYQGTLRVGQGDLGTRSPCAVRTS